MIEIGYMSTCGRSHVCWYKNCTTEVKKGDPVYRFYWNYWSRGMHITCAMRFLKETMSEMNKVGTRRPR